MQLDSAQERNQGPTPLRETWTTSDDSDVSWALNRAGTPHPPRLCLLCALPLPSPHEQVSPNEPLFSPCLVWGGNRHQKVAYKQRQGQDQRRREFAPAATGAAGYIPTVSLRLWTLMPIVNFGSITSWSKARSESKLTLQHTQQVDRPLEILEDFFSRTGCCSPC